MPESLEERILEWCIRRSRRSAKGIIRSKEFIESLRKVFPEDPISIRRALRSLRQGGKLTFKADLNDEPLPSGYVYVPPQTKQTSKDEERWSDVLRNTELNEADVEILMPLWPATKGLAVREMRCLIAGLKCLRREQQREVGKQLFTVSAKYILGSSKALSTLDKAVLRTFGIDIALFENRPRYIMVGGECESPSAVLFIENPVAFEQAVNSAAASRCGFLCTFGYGLSNSESEYGNQLAAMFEEGLANIVPIYRATTSAKQLSEILGAAPLHFWGDLDAEGLRIYERLQAKLPRLTFSALYQPMISAIEDPARRHPYVRLSNKQGQKAIPPRTEKARELFKYCECFAVDQEIVTIEEIAAFAGVAL